MEYKPEEFGDFEEPLARVDAEVAVKDYQELEAWVVNCAAFEESVKWVEQMIGLVDLGEIVAAVG